MMFFPAARRRRRAAFWEPPGPFTQELFLTTDPTVTDGSGGMVSLVPVVTL